MKTKKNTRRSPKRRRFKNKQKKRVYRSRNWREYNVALVQRGSLTLWVEQEVLETWPNQERSGRRDASCTYTETAICTGLTLKAAYHLPLRATEGLLTSLVKLMGLMQLPVPDYSTLCRRQKTLEVGLPQQHKGNDHCLRQPHW